MLIRYSVWTRKGDQVDKFSQASMEESIRLSNRLREDKELDEIIIVRKLIKQKACCATTMEQKFFNMDGEEIEIDKTMWD